MFNPKKFMKSANREDGSQKTIEENMKDLGATNDAIEYAMHIINRKQSTITRLGNKNTTIGKDLEIAKQNIEVANRIIVPISNRYLRVAKTENSRSKMTVNPCDGRCELKIHKGASDKVIEELKELAYSIVECGNFTARTYRGKIRWRNDIAVYEVSMCAENKGIEAIGFTYNPIK